MRDNFVGHTEIVIQPQDVMIPYVFKFEANSSDISNDGYLPYGSTINSAVVTGVDTTGDEIVGLVVSSSVLNYLYVKVWLSYPGDPYLGRAGLHFVLTLDPAPSILEADFTRVRIINLGFS